MAIIPFDIKKISGGSGIVPFAVPKSVQSTPTPQSAIPTVSGYGVSQNVDTRSPTKTPYLKYPFTIPKSSFAPETTISLEDKSRLAVPFDITKPVPADISKVDFSMNRMPSTVSQALRDKLGTAYNEDLDHKIAVALSGSNANENLQNLPTKENQKYGGLESQLIKDVRDRKISLLDAQMADAKAKGKQLPPTIEKRGVIEQWLLDHSKILGGLGKVQNFIEGIPSAIGGTIKGLTEQYTKPSETTLGVEKLLGVGQQKTLPEKISAPMNDFFTKAFVRTFAPMLEPLGKDIAEGVVANELLPEIESGKLPIEVLNQFETLTKSAPQIVGDVAMAVLAAYSPTVFGRNAVLFKNAPIRTAITRGLISGSEVGLGFGTAWALSSGTKDPVEFATRVGESIVTMGILGAITSGIIPVSKEVFNKTKEFQSKLESDFIAKGYTPEEAKMYASKGGYIGEFPKKEEPLVEEARLTGAEKQLGKKAVVPLKESGIAGTKAAEEKFAMNQEIAATNAKLESGLKAEEKPGFFKQIKQTLNPFKYQDTSVKEAWQKQVRGDAVANEKANLEFQKLSDLPRGVDSMVKYQTGGMENTWVYKQRVKKVFDNLFKEANAKGIETGYTENYLPQVYANKKEDVINAVIKYMKDKGVPENTIKEYIDGLPLPAEYSTSLKMSPTFAKERVFPNYKVAMDYGLTPKYDNPAQLAAYYRNELEKLVSNREFLQTLKENHDVVGTKLEGYKAVDVPFTNEDLYAKPKLASALNNYFRDEANIGIGAKIAKFVANASRRMQELVLSGGVPSTNINFFTIGQGIKNLTAAEGKVLGFLARSNFDSWTMGWFRANQSYITKMAEEGIDLSRRTGNWDNVYEQLSSKTGFSRLMEWFGEKFDALFNKKTFQSYMPMQAISVFKTTFDSAVGKGLSEAEARKLAGETTKAWEGIIENWGRGKTIADVVNSLFFAPRFREGLINLFGNTVKSLSSEITNPAFAKNRKFIMGMAITFALYNLLNKQLNGNYMWANEPGKEFDLKIPIGDGKFTYIAFLPSVLAFPRNMISGGIALFNFDTALAGQKFGSVFSMPIKLTSEIASNKDYFGRPIWNVDDTKIDQMKAMAKYIGIDQYNHPYVQGIYNAIFAADGKQKSWYEIMSKMAELPFKFNTQSNIDMGKFYDAMDAQQQARNKAEEPVKKIYDELQTMKAEGKKTEADAIYNKLPDNQKTLYDDIKQSEKTKATKELKAKLYPIYLQNQELKREGKGNEADTIYNALSEEEKDVYELLKQQFKSYE